MKTALVVIATGEKYQQFARKLITSADKYFIPHDVFLFTDFEAQAHHFLPSVASPKFLALHYIQSKGYPNETLFRYHTILSQRSELEKYDQLFYMDADMLLVAPIGDEIFSVGITATLHPGYVGTVGTPERRPESMAAIPFDAQNKYFCGGFQGGDAKTYLAAAKEMAWRIDEDQKRGITPIWHDESVFNRFLFERPPSKILSPAYCYPDVKNDYYTKKWEDAGLGKIEPILLALEKPWRKP